ncbi:MAG: hypothetical protein Fur0037_10130 [Planctomycetota bacterium]
MAIFCGAVCAQGTPPAESVIPPRTARITVDGSLAEWDPFVPTFVLAEAGSLVDGAVGWRGPADLSGQFALVYDTNHLYLAGRVLDDELDPVTSTTPDGQIDSDAVELRLRSLGEGRDAGATGVEGHDIWLMPLDPARPWAVFEVQGTVLSAARQTGPGLTGFQLASRPIEGGYEFEAVIPFHQLPSILPGTRRTGLEIVLHDADPGKPRRRLSLSSAGGGSAGDKGIRVVRFLGAGPLVAPEQSGPFLTSRLLADLPFVLIPVLAVAVLVLLLRAWSTMSARVRWLRPILLIGGTAAFVSGLFFSDVWMEVRARREQADLDRATAALQQHIRKMEEGTLGSYRGASRDRALMDLLAGKSIARQKYTRYRFLSEVEGSGFGSPIATYPDEDFPVRPYWLPLVPNRTEAFTFDPPLQGETLFVVVGRPFVPAIVPRELAEPSLRIEQATGRLSDRPHSSTVTFERPFQVAESLRGDAFEVSWATVDLHGSVRTLSITAEQGPDLRLVGLSLSPTRSEPVRPLVLGSTSLGGVFTDLRGEWPQDAGIELGPGATAQVRIEPGRVEPASKLWLFYRATYPGVPSASTGEKVAEVLLRFRNGIPDRSIAFEHQVSMFYELAVHNTRDEPPPESPASVAFSWMDEMKERHVNLVYPVTDLPAGSELELIEFKNLAGYRMRFRSVVLGEEKAAAPQDPADSPLIPDGPDRRRLRDEVLRELRGLVISDYRDGRLSESTLAPDKRPDQQTLPRAAMDVPGGKPVTVEEFLPGGARRLSNYTALTTDGWDGAVLAVSSLDEAWDSVRQTSSLAGLALCLGSSPILLILFSELLSILHNLRLRLMAVLSVASLVPLAVLSIVLAQVLEQGHENDLREGMKQQVQSATRQLGEQENLLRVSCQRWLHDLAALWQDRLGLVARDRLADGVADLTPELGQLLTGQLPPEWRGGFLKLQWNPDPGLGIQPKPIVAGDARLAGEETPARLEPGIYLRWGNVLIGVRSEESIVGGMLSLTVGRPLNSDFLGALSPGQIVLLSDVKGYPLDIGVSGGHQDARALFRRAMNPRVMAEREEAVFAALDRRQPVVQRDSSDAGDWFFGCDVLRDLQGTPRGLLVLAQPDQRATLELAFGRVPVRAFFLSVAGLLLVLSAFLSFVVSSRISRPVERLELGAQAISRGDLDARVPVDEGGQIGRLTRTFNQMAEDVQSRTRDMHLLNRVMRELSAHLDLGQVIATLRQFCEQNSPADRVAVLVFEPEAASIEVFDGGSPERLDLPKAWQFLSRVGGAFCIRLDRQRSGDDVLVQRFAGLRAATGLPMSSAGRCRGIVLLLFERDTPPSVHIDLLGTVAAQAAVALDNAQLYRHAVQDPVTGAFMPDYFRRRVGEEVGLAQQRGQPLALLGIGLGDGSRRPRGLLRFVALLREYLPAGSVVCHLGAGQFQILVPGHDRPAAEALMGRLLEAWVSFSRLPENAGSVEEHRPTCALVVFPDEAASAEFLYEALRDRLASGSAIESAVVESDESLQKAGVTAVSPSMREVYRTLRRVAPTDLTVLLEGETGTGKEVLTNLLHRWSKRANGPLVRVHCAALSETLLASELFGHEKGAFTGADRRRIGKFEQANGGTVFLDEVSEIPLDVQVKLLRVLQEREIDRVGGAEPVPVDVRVIAATNRNIREMVERGAFREDLYYRLQGMVVRVPPLRERKQEIPALVEHFRREVVAAGQSRVKGFHTDAMDELFRRSWRGNIRELRNAVFRAMVLASGDHVTLRDLLQALPPEERESAAGGERGIAPFVRVPAGVPEGSGGILEEKRGGGARPLRAEPASAPPRRTLLPRPDPPPLVVPSAGPKEQPPAPDALPDRLRRLLDLAIARGSVSTQDHMAEHGISHRTGLRDIQQLVMLGYLVREGKRRGARYRPTPGMARKTK